MKGHINGISKESYLKVAQDPVARASFEFDIMEHISDTFKAQPGLCDRRFVKVKHLKLVGATLLGAVIAYEGVPWDTVWSIIKKIF